MCGYTIPPLQKGSYEEDKKMNRLKRAVVGGLAGLALLVSTACQEPEGYGCEDEDDVSKQEQPYDVDVDCRHYLTHTGIMVKDGDELDVSAKGKCCWDGDSLCAGPEGSYSAWGLYWMFMKDSDDAGYNYDLLGTSFSGEVNFPDQDKYELVLVIPEGSNKERCYADMYVTNKGGYDVTIEKTEGE
jgi:hypothetical protein